jgi:AraC-like DNA-binding protein
MEFTVHEPPPQLADSVKAIWCARGTKQEFEAPEPIVPDGCVEVIFNLGERFINADAGNLQPRDLLAGQMTRPVIALPTGDVDLIGVRFRTGRAGAALRVPMAELQDQLIAASDVVSGLDRIAGDLRGVAQDDRLNHLARSLGERLAPIDAGSLSAVDHALAIIGAMRGNVAIERVAQRVGITRRQLERHFHEHVGVGAKRLARITRVQTALQLLHQQPSMSGAEIAAACGYSDQAHLIRECQQLTGQTPQRLKTTERSLAGLMRDPAGRDRHDRRK